MTISGHLLLVGCGKMGGALLRGWLQRGVRPGDVTVVEPNMAPVADLAGKGVRFLDDGASCRPSCSPRSSSWP
jgi:pyrroline-5-carboxylate reductase